VKGRSVFIPIGQTPKADFAIVSCHREKRRKPLQPIQKQKKNGIN
jgi:hypothetical protein